MAEQTLKDVGIWIEGVSYAGVSNSVSLDLSADTPEATVFKGEWRRRAEGGLKTTAFSLEGFFHTDGPDADQFDSLADERSVMIVPAGQVPGDLAYVVPVAVSGHELGGSIGELVAFTYAGEGDGRPFRAQVFDIRENVNSVVIPPRRQLFTAAPTIGARVDVWLHVARTSMAGTMQAELRSAAFQTGGATSTRANVAITGSGLYLLSYTVPDPAITHQWWGLSLSPAANGVYDVAAGVAVS